MSSDPYNQTVEMNPQNQTYSSTAVETVVGETNVGNNSYDIFGQQVDSTNDTPIDVNAASYVDTSNLNTEQPSTGLSPVVDADNRSGEQDPVQKNPNQSFLSTTSEEEQ